MALKLHLGGFKIDLQHTLKQFVIVAVVSRCSPALTHTLLNTWN